MRTVLDLCAGLGITSTVEGIENHEQLRLVTENGGMQVQGYLFSMPVSARQVSGLLDELAVGAAAHSSRETPVVLSDLSSTWASPH